MLKGFRDFIARGNVIDLAVGVIIGAAFGGIVDSLTKDLITPLIGLLGGQPDFSAIKAGAPQHRQLHQHDRELPDQGGGPLLPDRAALQPLRRADGRGAPPPPASETYLKEIRDLLAAQKK